MMIQSSATKILAGLVGSLICFMSAQAQAAADMKVTLQGPSSPQVYVAGTYTATISNVGNQTANGVALRIDLPLTATSPQVYILGELSAVDSRCLLINKGLNCSLGSFRRGSSLTLSFNFKFPQAAKVLSLKSIVSSSTLESNLANNTMILSPALDHPNLPISGDVEILNSHCTGTLLTSYFECLTSPSSLSQHLASFHQDGSISFAGAPEYSGAWEQVNSTKELHFQYFENGGLVAEFNGWAVDGNCFEGLTTFFPASNYVSPYRVCKQ